MSTITISSDNVVFDTPEGKVLCEGNLYDMSYSHVSVIEGKENVSKKDKYTEVAEMFIQEFRPEGIDNDKYTESISWGEAMTIALKLQSRLNEEKKS